MPRSRMAASSESSRSAEASQVYQLYGDSSMGPFPDDV